MKFAVLGFPDKDIAGKLKISVRTVNTYMARIYDKNSVKNRAEAVAMYLKDVMIHGVTAFGIM